MLYCICYVVIRKNVLLFIKDYSETNKTKVSYNVPPQKKSKSQHTYCLLEWPYHAPACYNENSFKNEIVIQNLHIIPWNISLFI